MVLIFIRLVTSALIDGDSMFLRNVVIEVQIHTAPKPKTYSSLEFIIVTTEFRQVMYSALVIISFARSSCLLPDNYC
jgi:hypothetical protein